MKKYTAILLALVLMLSMLGGVALASGGSDVTLTYWDMMWSDDPNYGQVVQGLADVFTEQTGIKVEVQIIPWDNHYQTFLTAINSGAAPDVCTGGAFQAIQYAAMDMTLDLTSIVDAWKADGSNILDDFIPGSIELQQYNDTQVGIPWNSDVREIYYRTDYLADAGYEGEAAWGIKSFDEFLDMLRAVKEAHPDVIPFIFPAGDYTATHTLMSFAAANNAGITDKEFQANTNSPEMLEVLEFFGTMVEEGLVSESAATYVSTDIVRLYAAGEVAVVWGPNPTFLAEYPDVQAATDLMQPVQGPSGDAPKGLVWTNPIIGFSTTKYPEETKQFIKWWAENNLTIYTEGKTGPLPVRQSFLQDEYFSSAWLPSLIASRDLMAYASSPVSPAEALYPEIADIEGNNLFGEMLQRVMLGETDYEAIANDANEKIAEALTLTTNAQ